MNPKTFIFIGRSGCGKGTQAELLIEYLKKNDANTPVYYLETGQSFRNFIEGGSYSSELAKVIYDHGELQPEFLAVWAWSHLMIENLKGGEHLIVDGTPRKAHEAAVLDSAMKFYRREKPNLVYVNVSSDWSRERLLARGRSDDNRDDIDQRLKWFDTDVVPAINFFKNNGDYNFIEVNGEQSVDAVHEEIIRAVEHV